MNPMRAKTRLRVGRRAADIASAIAAILLVTGWASGEAVAQSEGARFQQRQPLTCSQNPTNCRAIFTVVPSNRRMDIDFVSCFLQTATSIDSNKAAFLGVNDALSGQFRHTLIWEQRGTTGFNLIIVSQPVSLVVPEGKRADIAIPFPGLATGTGDCSISGRVVPVP
jgi:hypothetical protein